MARPLKSRKVCNPPAMRGFNPYGLPLCSVESVKLSFEEYECIHLINYLGLDQDEVAERMQVSRPTITRIYNKALKTIAIAFVEGKAIEIGGGNYVLDKDWYRCKRCHKLIEGIENHKKCEDCTHFGENELTPLSRDNS